MRRPRNVRCPVHPPRPNQPECLYGKRRMHPHTRPDASLPPITHSNFPTTAQWCICRGVRIGKAVLSAPDARRSVQHLRRVQDLSLGMRSIRLRTLLCAQSASTHLYQAKAFRRDCPRTSTVVDGGVHSHAAVGIPACLCEQRPDRMPLPGQPVMLFPVPQFCAWIHPDQHQTACNTAFHPGCPEPSRAHRHLHTTT